MSIIQIGPNKRKFTFSSKVHFDGSVFYEMYETAEFLTDLKNITKILSQGHELGEHLKFVEPGQVVTLEGMFITPGEPLVIKKSCQEDESDVPEHEFTFRRLSGLSAAAASSHPFFSMHILEAEGLGLSWGEEDLTQRLYLSAVSGAEHFVEQFDILPFICSLRKFQLGFVTAEEVLRIAAIPHADGESMKNRLQTKFTAETLQKLESKFVGEERFRIQKELSDCFVYSVAGSV